MLSTSVDGQLSREKGVIYYINPRKKFGVIRRDNGERLIFRFKENVEAVHAGLRLGDRVTFSFIEVKHYGVRAKDITKIESFEYI